MLQTNRSRTIRICALGPMSPKALTASVSAGQSKWSFKAPTNPLRVALCVSGTNRAPLNASLSKWARSCEAAVSSSYPFDLTIASNTCLCWSQQVSPLNLGTSNGSAPHWLSPQARFRLNRRSHFQHVNVTLQLRNNGQWPGQQYDRRRVNETKSRLCSKRWRRRRQCIRYQGPITFKMSQPGPVTCSGNGRGGIHTIVYPVY